MEMTIFHSHSFEYTKDMYKEAFQKIIIEHNMHHDVILRCKCGKTKKVFAQLQFSMDYEYFKDDLK